MARSMMAEGRMPGSIDQVAGLIHFETGTPRRAAMARRPSQRFRLTRLAPAHPTKDMPTPAGALASWDAHIESLCNQVAETAEAIVKRHPQYAATM